MCIIISNYMLAQSLNLHKNDMKQKIWVTQKRAGVTADLDPRGYGPPFADLDPPTKLSF